MSKIKLIYGNNGDGKTLYFNKKKNDLDYICLNYDISNWYFPDEKIISQEKYMNLNNRILFKKNYENVLERGNKLFGKISKSDFKKFLKENDFESYKSWVEYYNKLETSAFHDDKLDQESFLSLFEIWSDFKDFSSTIKNLSKIELDFLKIFTSFNYENVSLETREAISFQENILNMENSIIEKLTNVEKLSNLKKLKWTVIDKIKKNELDINKLANIIKNKIVNLPEVIELVRIDKLIEYTRTKSLNFSKFLDKETDLNIVDDGYSIEKNLSEELFSNGQKVYYILNTLLECFVKSKKTIILDDIFEKLDIENSVSALNSIFHLCKTFENINIEILTHDVNFVNLFELVYNNFPDYKTISVSKNIIKIINKEPILQPNELTLTFKKYISNVYSSLDGKNYKNIKNHILLIKLFSRDKMFNNIFHFTSDVFFKKNSNISFNQNITIQIYDFLSKNVFHYSERIDIQKFPFIKDYFNHEIFKKTINTVELYEYLISEFSKNPEIKYGVDTKKIVKMLEEMLEFIKKERDGFLIPNKDNTQIDVESIKKKRNILFHSLEYSLDKIKKTN